MTPLPFVLVRHGETDWNVAGRLQGQTDTPLNARGHDQAKAVGRALVAAFPDIGKRSFVASPLSRTRETMRDMRGAMGLPPDDFTTDDRLKELTFGRWEGSTLREITERDPAAMRARRAARWTHRPPGGENYADVAARLEAFLREREGPTVAVAHGGVARAVLSLLTDLAKDRLPDLRIPQGRALVFEKSGWRWL